MQNIKDFIQVRLTELEDSLVPLHQKQAELAKEVAAVEAEIADLRNAAKAVGIVTGLQFRPLGVTRKTATTPTIKEAALQVLSDYPDGLLALDLLAKMNDRFGLKLIRTSLSPQLTRLKREGKITNHGSTWLVPPGPRAIPK